MKAVFKIDQVDSVDERRRWNRRSCGRIRPAQLAMTETVPHIDEEESRAFSPIGCLTDRLIELRCLRVRPILLGLRDGTDGQQWHEVAVGVRMYGEDPWVSDDQHRRCGGQPCGDVREESIEAALQGDQILLDGSIVPCARR